MKHFALNSMENARFRVDVTVDERSLHEVYLPHFRRVAAEGVASVMSAYNSVNGEWCGENTTLLTDILREEWGWDGFVVSDFVFGLRDAVTSVRAGLDIEMPFRQQRAMRLPEAIESGDLDTASVDRAVEHIVATLLRFADVYDTRPPLAVVGSGAHRTLAREAAVASTVLLRNDDVLPVDPSMVGRVAVLGRLAAVPNLGDGGSSDVRASDVVTPLAGLRAAFDDVVHDDGDVSIVDGADLVVVVVGYTKDDEGEYIDDAGTAALAVELFAPMDHPTLGRDALWEPPAPTGRPRPTGTGTASSSERSAPMAPGGDRSSLRLSAADEALIAAATERHDRVVVVVQCGSAVVMPWADSVGAVLVTWYSGVEGGAALAGILTGAAEPCGRLPFAVPVDADDLVSFDRDASEVVYDLLHGQWKLDHDRVRAHFPFGWGLGYGAVRLDVAELVAEDRIRVRVVNDGAVATSAVVFVFAGHDGSRFERPPSRLVGFARMEVGAGAAASVEVELDWSMLDVRTGGAWFTEPGIYRIDVGLHAGDPAALRLAVERD
jgi:beta-glucosidase